ncbi:hypothetical protein [Raineya orbicola]|uniref:Uncharacterized protein n=1 Tax=Raineya orbicola TaxID=2016530 RepID=A0A2N3IAV5_9BACT|nr:hypothetical protein [Raineya orbicola]PKQ67410.1 hypothetical protein Rain11_2089 [Raineya orbicola]
MLEYFKMILEKVSFDKLLFEKELRKALAQLKPTEREDLRRWCYLNFTKYHQILNNQFKMVLS